MSLNTVNEVHETGVPHSDGTRQELPRENFPSRPLNRTERAAWLGLLSTHLKLLRTLDTELVAAERLPMSSFEVLLTLAESPGGHLRMKDIAASLLISRSGLTRIVDDLERQGFVERRKCSSDARGFDAVLTETGKKAYRRARKVHLTGLRREFLDKLSEEQLTALSEIWQTVGFSETADTC
ncbi:MarR family winged helix-turn-helix transcriptional regulator [Streptomyces albipurpureus]|uniref:MarR family transcriptional regulator n=1 Tax=Streptomyces albipurpureus TaxID=2897419 RepID=A0ABT0USA5_9ACTN|nr:MarR family transcriptional regulator [Streptomyces sp. CWNU-1]MCM2390505.1 MarR family transcriptional regulator [Streptomyces sp. CWNU-1]